MVHRYSFIPVFSVLLGGLAWWSHVESPRLPKNLASCGISAPCNESTLEDNWVRRKRLIESLDRLVTSELRYRDTHGGFTKFLSRTGFALPQNLSRSYDLKVAEASGNRLLIQAFSKDKKPIFENMWQNSGESQDESGGESSNDRFRSGSSDQVLDWVSIDQDFKIQANFELKPLNRVPSSIAASGSPGVGSVGSSEDLEIEVIDDNPDQSNSK